MTKHDDVKDFSGDNHREDRRREAWESPSFGARFGLMVRSFRDDLGLSVKDLAVRAWNDEGRKASISRLENGHVANPNARTVQTLAHALDIPQDDIDALRETAQQAAQQTTQPLTAQLDGLGNARRDQLEALANRFEIDRAYDKSDAELRALLDEKATEYRVFKERFEELDGLAEDLTNTKLAAAKAAAQLDFAEYDLLLLKVDRIYSSMAVRAKEARAHNALLRGRTEEAFWVFSSAAEALNTLDPIQSAEKRLDYHRLLFEHGLRYDLAGLRHSANILKPAIEVHYWPAGRRARALQNYANALANIGMRCDLPEAATLLDEAIEAYHQALHLVTDKEDSDVWAMIQQNLGATLSLRAKYAAHEGERSSYLGHAIEAFSTALKLRSKTDKPTEWAMTTQNLAVALLEKAMLTTKRDSAEETATALLQQAKTLFEDTLKVRTESDAPFDWALTQENLAIVTKALGERTQAEVSAKYFARAEAHIQAALQVYEGEAGHFYRAKARMLKEQIQKTTLSRQM